MAAAEITVSRLRLRSAAPGLRPRLEDALRVSSKPPALLNRFVLVRRLRLRAAAEASAQTLALHLERAWQQLAAQAQAIEQADDSADAVWAPSLAAARQALLRRWLRGAPDQAWFWQRIAPPLPGAAWPARALAMMEMPLDDRVSTVAARPSAQHTAQLQALLQLIAAHGAAAAFVQGLADGEVLTLLRRLETADAAPQRARRQRSGPHAAAPLASAREHLLDVLNAWAPSVAAPRPTVSRWPAREPAEEGRRIEGISADPDTAMPAWNAVAAPQEPVRVIADAVRTPEDPVALDHGLASPWSGLWLLLPILLRHGLDDAEDPLAVWAGALQAGCRRFRIPTDDPIHAALSALDLPAAGASGLRTARLAAVRDARLPLLRIARRPGRAWVSPERMDIEFPAAALDLRIRRAGFDIDPGFVPWLGRIVHFHYPSS